MNRSRALVAAVLSVVLLAVAAPALEARPLAKPQVSVQALGGEWLNAAWTWLAQALRFEPATPAARQEKAKKDPTTETGGGPGAREAGSCIDPWGGSCFSGGGG